VPIDRNSLPKDPEVLQEMLVSLTQQLDKTQRLLQQLLAHRSGTRSEQLSAFATELGLALTPLGEKGKPADANNDSEGEPPESGSVAGDKGKTRGRRALPSHLKRERIVHDLAEQDKHCAGCGEDLRHIGEEVSERYEYIPAQMLVMEDACQKYACSCTVKTATKPAQRAGACDCEQGGGPPSGSPASKNNAAFRSGPRRSNDMRMDAAKRGTAGAPVPEAESVRASVQSSGHR
jgi:hypothetical protein